MFAFNLLLAASATGLVAAWPEPVEQRAIDCAKVTGALSVLKKVGPPATTFCSAFLKIPATKTLMTTVTPNPVTVATATSTSTYYAPSDALCRVVVQRNTLFEPEEPVPDAEERRADILPVLATFAAAKISEGCSCLGLQPRATTTATVAAAAPVVNRIATTVVCTNCLPNGQDAVCSADNQCCYGRCRTNISGVRSCCRPDGDYCGNTAAECCGGVCQDRGPGTRVCVGISLPA